MSRMDRNLLNFVAGALALISADVHVGTSFAQEAKPASAVVISLAEAIHRAQNEPDCCAGCAMNCLGQQMTTALAQGRLT